MAEAFIIIPPFLKSVSGPLLGPAMLVGAARAAGHRVEVFDLNAEYVRQRLDFRTYTPGPFIGDHDRPSEPLRLLQRDFVATCAGVLPCRASSYDEDQVTALRYSQAEIRSAAQALATDPLVGGWFAHQISECGVKPGVVGISVMHSGQVLWGLVATILSRQTWPDALVVWGGPHVTALREEIAGDPAFGFAADCFVFGHAERTFIDILAARDRHLSLPSSAIVAGRGRWISALDDPDVVPDFANSQCDWPRLTLPTQTSRGCVYGRCSFCTYPTIEGQVRLADDRHLLGVVNAAQKSGAVVSLKDSLVVPPRLEHVAALIRGRVRWSACTKLHPRIDRGFAGRLATAGCRTIEVGLETLTGNGQLLFDKKQTPDLFLRVIESLAEAGIAVVVNYMTGLPGVDPEEEIRWLAWVRDTARGFGPLAKVEHNGFQLERLSPMGMMPERFGLRVTRRWPWASVIEWEQQRSLLVSAA